MKRYGNLYDQIATFENIDKAAEIAIEGKGSRTEVQRFLADRDSLLHSLLEKFQNRTVQMSEMRSFVVYEPKKRVIHHPPFYPDRIIHHALMNVIKPILKRNFIHETYSSIEGQGLTQMADKVKRMIRDNTCTYYLQMDIHHYFQSVDHDILMDKVRRLIKCEETVNLVRKIVEAHSEGLAIGVFPSQYLANLYLSELDHYIKEKLRIKHYVRYMDDILIICEDKATAHFYQEAITAELDKLKLKVKNNVRIAPLTIGIDFCGYKFFPTHTLLRKRIKQNMKKQLRKYQHLPDKEFKQKLASHWGWCKRANCMNLKRKLFKERYDIMLRRLSDIKADAFWGITKDKRVSITELIDQDIAIFDYKPITIKGEQKVIVKFAYPDNEDDFHTFITRSEVIMDRLALDKDNMPFIVKIKRKGRYFCYE